MTARPMLVRGPGTLGKVHMGPKGDAEHDAVAACDDTTGSLLSIPQNPVHPSWHGGTTMSACVTLSPLAPLTPIPALRAPAVGCSLWRCVTWRTRQRRPRCCDIGRYSHAHMASCLP